MILKGLYKLIQLLVLMTIAPVAMALTIPCIFVVAGIVGTMGFFDDEIIPGYVKAIKEALQ